LTSSTPNLLLYGLRLTVNLEGEGYGHIPFPGNINLFMGGECRGLVQADTTLVTISTLDAVAVSTLIGLILREDMENRKPGPGYIHPPDE